MFTSPKAVVFMGCGHSIHQRCYDEHMKRSYKCPICNKSLLNMQSQFRQLELAILSQPMPPEFRDTRATVLCNDCSGRSSVAYHWLGLKCAICTSYNTVELQISGPREGAAAPTTPAAAPAPANAVVPAQVVPAVSEAQPIRAEAPPGGRRRHSSHAGAEARSVMLDRLARSASPVPTPGLPPNNLHGAIEEEDEEENNIFELWSRAAQRGFEEDSDSMSTDEEDEYDDDDDDDDENDFMLIGHR